MKKYELTDETIKHGSYTLYRIRALRALPGIKAGELGGFVESEKNLSHDGDCFVYDSAMVYNRGEVHENAQVRNDAIVHEGSYICGHAQVLDSAVTLGWAVIDGAQVLRGEGLAWALDRARRRTGAQKPRNH